MASHRFRDTMSTDVYKLKHSSILIQPIIIYFYAIMMAKIDCAIRAQIVYAQVYAILFVIKNQ